MTPGYGRSEVELGPPAMGALDGARRSARRVSFGPIGHAAADAHWAAIYDCEGTMLAYGRPQRCAGNVGAGEIAFETIHLRF